MVQAGSMGIPYVPTRGFAGSDAIAHRDDFTIAPNPFDPEERIVVAKAINPDVGIFHGLKGDRAGNVLLRKGGDELMLAQACRKVIVTVEEIVDRVSPEGSQGIFIPSIHITAVAHAPFGAHPTAAPGYYQADDAMLKEYVDASRSDEAFQAFLTRYVLEPRSHQEYLERVGLAPMREAVAT